MKKLSNLGIIGVRASTANQSIHGLVVKILRQSNRPMRARKITDKVMKVKKMKSKTPLNTIVHILQTSKHTFRVGYGLYRFKA